VGCERCRGRARCRLARAGLALDHHQAAGREWDGTAGMEQAAVADCHEAVRQDMLEEPTEKRHDVKASSPEACTAHFPGGEGDRAVREADKTLVGDSDLEARGSEGGAGGRAVVMRLPVDVPGDGPELGGDVLQQSGLAPTVFEARAGDG
jgi:hypothetical protein